MMSSLYSIASGRKFILTAGLAALVLGLAALPAQASWISWTYDNYGNITNFSTADAAILHGTLVNPGGTLESVINMFDPRGGGGIGHFGSDTLVPGLPTNQDNNDFVVHSTGTLTVATAGTFIFQDNNDDGSRL